MLKPEGAASPPAACPLSIHACTHIYPTHPIAFVAISHLLQPHSLGQMGYTFTFCIYSGHSYLCQRSWRHFRRQKPGKPYSCSRQALLPTPSCQGKLQQHFSLYSEATKQGNHSETQIDTKGTNNKKEVCMQYHLKTAIC